MGSVVRGARIRDESGACAFSLKKLLGVKVITLRCQWATFMKVAH